MLICPQDTCRTENPENAKFCLRCGTDLRPGEPPNDNAPPFNPDLDVITTLEGGRDIPEWDQQREASSPRVIAAIIASIALLAGGVFIFNANKSEAFSMTDQAQVLAEELNELHSRGCEIFISTGGTSDPDSTKLERNAQQGARSYEAQGASATAFHIDRAARKDLSVRQSDGTDKDATFVGTLVGVVCE